MTYEERVAELEAEGLTTSDAQAIVDAEILKETAKTEKEALRQARKEGAAEIIEIRG